jgi:prophage DNA circulation protein
MTARIGIRRAVSAVAQATTTTAGALSIRRAVSGVVNVVSTLTGALSISAATKRFSAVGRTRGKLRSGRTRGKLRFSGKTKGK